MWTARKRVEELRYLHCNPVQRCLVASPELWRWSGFRAHSLGEPGPVQVNAWQVLKMKIRNGPHKRGVQKPSAAGRPLLEKREKWRTPSFGRVIGGAGVRYTLRPDVAHPPEVVSDLPAVLRRLGDWAEETSLPMLPSVCFEAGRITLTQSSWTAPHYCSRKWMSGQADALTVAKDQGRFAQPTSFPAALREHLSAGRPQSLLDFYLSWMSPNFRSH